MKVAREFLQELYQNRINSMPFIQHFQNDRDLRNSLYEIFRHKKNTSFIQIDLFKKLDLISKEINDFKELVLTNRSYDTSEYSSNFSKNFIYKLEGLKIPKLTEIILNDFVNEEKNFNILSASIVLEHEHAFFKRYGISIDNANREYRALKMYANNKIIDYLKNNDKKKKTVNTESIREKYLINKIDEAEKLTQDDNKPYLTTFERIDRELNIVAWAYECQFMEASASMEYPMLHSKGRYLAGMYTITSNIKMIKLQDYIQHYTERFEGTNNTVLVKNELFQIHKKASNILEFYNENFSSECDIIKNFHNNIPNGITERGNYFKNHTVTIITENLYPLHIVFGEEAIGAGWGNENHLNYSVTNHELALFCKKLISFINKLDIKKKAKINNKSALNGTDNKYRPKEIKIAYFCMQELITTDNYLEILNKYSKSKSDKILQNQIVKSNQLTSISQNKSADTKHLKALKNAKRLLSGIKNEEALKSINQFISTFESNRKKYYE